MPISEKKVQKLKDILDGVVLGNKIVNNHLLYSISRKLQIEKIAKQR